MSQRSSSCPPLPGSVCSDSALSVTFQPANAVLASRALRRDLLTCEPHLPYALLLPFLATRHSPLFLSLLFATDPRNPWLTPFLATLPKTCSCKSFVCHTSETPRGVLARSLATGLCPLYPACLPRMPAKSRRASMSQADVHTDRLTSLFM